MGTVIDIQKPLKWELQVSIAGEKYHSLLYRSKVNGKGVQMEIHTPVLDNGEFGRGKAYYFADGVNKEFKSEEELLKALEH